MSDQESTSPEGEKPEAEKKTEAEQPQTFDKAYVAELRSEAAQRRVEIQQLREQLEERDEKEKSELEKAQGKATKAEQRAAEAENKLLRFQVATEKELPSAFVSRLQGNTREELEADADALLELVKSRSEQEKTPDFDGGAREPAEDTDPASAHNKLVADLLLGNTRT